jgi:hypothetical protein
MSEARIGNIGPGGRRRRLIMGALLAVVGLVLVVGLILARVTPGWVLVAVVPFWLGALGLIQAREQT